MFSLISNLKLIGIVFLVSLIVTGSAKIWYLSKENESLVSKLTVAEAELRQCVASSQLHEEKEKVVDQVINDVLNKHEEIEDTFTDLKDSLNKQKCKDRVVYKKADVANEKDVDGVAAELDSVRVLLERAACSANGTCKPSEILSTPL